MACSGFADASTATSIAGHVRPAEQGGDRALAINSGKQSYYCFSQKKGGDVIALVAHLRGMTQKDAAAYLDQQFGNSGQSHSDTVHSSRNNSPSPPVQQGRELKPLDYLDSTRQSGASMSEATCKAWGAGYAPKGIMRGRLAIPIHDRAGTLLAYCGRSVKGESPTLIFPNGFDPHGAIFAAERVQAGQLCLVRDPLDVLAAYEQGVENVVAFLTDDISAQQLEMLAALMDEKKCDSVELH